MFDSDVTSLIYKVKEEFEAKMKRNLITDALRNVILGSIPATNEEQHKLNDPAFREKFNQVLDPITQNFVDQFQSVGQFDTGNMFTSMVTSISDSVSLESDFRLQKVNNAFRLGRIKADETGSWRSHVYKAFESMEFKSADIKNRFVQDMKRVLSMEEANEVIDGIKDEVKNAIEETESKNDLVEGTTKEILDYKKEIAPPDDKYVDPQNPDDTGDTGGDDTGDDPDANADQSTEDQDPNADLDPQAATADAGGDDPAAAGDTPPAGDGTGAGDTTADTSSLDDPAAADAGDTPPASDPAATATQGANVGGITINITAPDMKKAKENLNLFTCESFAQKYIPLHVRSFNDLSLPDVNVMASECVNVTGGNVPHEIGIRFDGLKLAIRQSQLSKEDTAALTLKMDQYKAIATEALDKGQIFADALGKLGLTQNGLFNSTESTLYAARNIIARFLTKTKGINPMSLPYTSRENIMSNAFDIVQLRQEVNKSDNPDTNMVDDLISRESVFYKGLIEYDDKKVQDEAAAVIDLTDMKFEKAMSANFITDYRIKAWEMNVGKDQKDTNAEVVKRVKEKFEEFWGRTLNDEELDIIKATTNGEDVTEIIPSPYEKFVIKLSKEAYLGRSNENGISIAHGLSEDQKTNIKFKAKLLTTVYKAAERFNLIDSNDVMEFENFCGMFGTEGYLG